MKQQTPSTSTEYVEPLGFKGTKGEWDCGYGDFSKSYGIFTKKMLDEGLFESPICLVSPMDKLDDNDKANAKLISKSKELAKALQDILIDLNEWHYYNLNEVDSFDGDEKKMQLLKANGIYQRYNNAKQVLKQAGLTE